jgi:predicted transposase/invertase (TIGR01784 family)
MTEKNDDFEGGSDANRQYKDSVFTLLFSDKVKLADMYGGITGMEIEPNKIKLTTLKRVLSGGVYNDLAFVLNDKLVVLIEHQSTVNENMPLRMLLYIAETYSYLSEDKDLYSPDMFKIPRPEFIVLYNGVKDVPDMQVLRLSDMFEDTDEAAGISVNLELVVTVYNINKGRNPEMAKRSPTLDEYETFIHKVRENEKTMSLKDAITKAVTDCIEQNILKTFLQKHKWEVIGMLLHEWNLDTAVAFAEERGEGRGMRQRTIEIARNLKNAGRLTIDEIAQASGLTVDDILRL